MASPPSGRVRRSLILAMPGLDLPERLGAGTQRAPTGPIHGTGAALAAGTAAGSAPGTEATLAVGVEAVLLADTASASAVGMAAASPVCTEVVLAVGTQVVSAVGTVAVLAAGTATDVEPFDYRRVAMLISKFARGVTLAALLVPSIGFAQSATTSGHSTAATAPTAASPSTAEPAIPAPSAATQAAVDQRIRALQSQLGITEAQMPLWNAFAQAMRDNAASTDALFSQRANAVASMSAVDNMHSYVQIARGYADNTERLATAFDSLYASLTDTQRQAADTLFRQQGSAATQPRTRH